ncbi:MAG: NDP-sugar synthase [Verrucomicrobiota bacterium]
MLKTAVMIAGGEGIRLRPLTNDCPKALAPVHGQPLLYWVISWLKRQGIRRLVIGVAYRKEDIRAYLGVNESFGLEIEFSEHSVAGGTAEAFKQAIARYVDDDEFLALNCDEITNLDLARFYKQHRDRQAPVTMALAPFRCRFSVAEVGDGDMIENFTYGQLVKNVLVSIGIYIFHRSVLDLIPDQGSIEDLVFTPLSERREPAAYRLAADEEWISVNDIKDVQEAERRVHLLRPMPD